MGLLARISCLRFPQQGVLHAQDYWSFPSLVTETDQPVAWLKEVLLGLAVQTKKSGPHRDHWLLKPEYRTKELAEAE